MSEWQPIETHPLDHRRCLVKGEYGILVAFLDVTLKWWPVPPRGELGYTPTHWMPLPEPPK